MGQKSNPRVLRLGIVSSCDSSWFALKNYGEYLEQDFFIRNYLKGSFYKAGISKILIERKAGVIVIKLFVAKMGVILGKNAVDISVHTDQIKRKINSKVSINVVEEKNPDGSAKVLGEWMASQIEARVAFRRVMKMAIQRAFKLSCVGVKVECSGRLGGLEIARTEWYMEGKLPLHTLRADIHYAFSEALTTYGKIGIKVWINKGIK